MPISRLAIVIVSIAATGCAGALPSAHRSGRPELEAAVPLPGDALTGASEHSENKIADTASDDDRPRNIAAPPPSTNHERSMGQSSNLTDLLQNARQQTEAGRPDAARTIYEQILAQDADNPDAHHGLAVIADNASDFAAAEEHYRAAVSKRPADAGLLSDFGYSYLMQNRLDESIIVLTRAVQIDPSHRRGHNNLGLAYALQQDRERAFEFFCKADGEDAARARIAQLFPETESSVAVSRAHIADRNASPAGFSSEVQIVPRPTIQAMNESAADATLPANDAAASAVISSPQRAAATVTRLANLEQWPPPENNQPAAAAPNRIVEDRQTRDRQAAWLGMNIGACGPFPMIDHGPKPAAWHGSDQNELPVSSSPNAPSPVDVLPAFDVRSVNGNRPREADVWPAGGMTEPLQRGNVIPNPASTARNDNFASPIDPLTRFEADLKRRATEDYTTQRSFRTGAASRSSLPH